MNRFHQAIASKFGVPESRLRQANRIPNNVRLASAQTLLIPGPSGEGIRLNPADKTSLAMAGRGAPSRAAPPPAATRMTTVRTSATPATSATAQNNPTTRPTSGGAVRTHTVRAGETLSSIALHYGTTVASIRALNNLKSDNLRIGLRLRVPDTNNRS